MPTIEVTAEGRQPTRSDYAYFPKLYLKSYLLEIKDKKSLKVVQSFAFSLPPESVRIEVGQRVNETKTFGGLFTDDYGVDSGELTMSGTTGNGQFKEVYVDGQSTFVTGEEEAYHVLQEIAYYKEKDPTAYHDWEMTLYDLSSLSAGFNESRNSLWIMNINAWVVNLKKCSISRNKDKPLWYNYDLQFTLVMRGGRRRAIARRTEFVPPPIEESLDAAEKALTKLQQIYAGYREVLAAINNANASLQNFRMGIQNYYRAIRGEINDLIEAINSVFDIVNFPLDLAEDFVRASLDVKLKAISVWDTVVSRSVGIVDRAVFIWDLTKVVLELEQAASEAKVNALAAGASPTIMVVPAGFGARSASTSGGSVTEGASLGFEILKTYGHYEVIATSETTLERLSNEAYGSPENSGTIAMYNGIYSDDDIVPGMKLYIPYLSFTSDLASNQVYSPTSDPYGSDVRLDENGDLLLAEFGDYVTLDGIENVSQAIDLRISEDIGTRIRLTNYGIVTPTGNYDSISAAVMIESIKDTLVQDPRVKDASDFTLQSTGDASVLSFHVGLNGGGTVSFAVNL